MREAGDVQNIMIALWDLAAIDIDLGDLDIARPRLAEGISLMVDTADKSMRQDGIELAGGAGDGAG